MERPGLSRSSGICSSRAMHCSRAEVVKPLKSLLLLLAMLQLHQRMGGCDASPSLPVSVGWHPGHYVASTSLSCAAPEKCAAQARSEWKTALMSDGNLKGARAVYTWHDLEIAQGEYNFTVIDDDIEYLRSLNPSYRLIIEIWTRDFSRKAAVPKTPQDSREAGVPDYLIDAGGAVVNYNGVCAAVWRPVVMRRVVALYEALATRYDGNRAVEAVHSDEFAPPKPTTEDPTYSSAGAWAQWQVLMRAMARLWPKTNKIFLGNWPGIGGSGESGTPITLEFARSVGFGAGGPDILPNRSIWPGDKDRETWGEQGLQGINGYGDADFRGTMPISYQNENPYQWDGLTPSMVERYAYENLRATHVTWIYASATTGKGLMPWSATLAALRAHAFRIHSECPSNYHGSCDTHPVHAAEAPPGSLLHDPPADIRETARQAATELAQTMLSSNYFVHDTSKAPWTIGYWQEANLCETFANFLIGNLSSSVALERRMVHAMSRSFEHYPAQWLVTNAPEKDSYDDLLWWALAYLRAHELCQARPDLLNCTVRLPRPTQQPCTCKPCGSSEPHNFSTPGSQCSPATSSCGATSGPPSKSAGTCYTDCIASCNCVELTCTVEVPEMGPATTLLEQGKLIFDFAYNRSWNTDYCQGGFAWSLTSQNYKNCVTNQLGILTANKLGRLLEAAGRGAEPCACKAAQPYTEIGARTAAWLAAAPMRNSSSSLYHNELYCSAHNVSAGRVTTCTGTNTPIWSYCQALPIGFDVELHRRTGDEKHLDDAFLISRAVQQYMTVPATWADGSGNVLMEFACGTDSVCGWFVPPLPSSCKCDNNAMIYKGIMARYLGYLHSYSSHTHPSEASRIRQFIEDNVNSVLANNRAEPGHDPGGFGLLWQGPVFGLVESNGGNVNQAVLDLLVAAAY